MVDDRGSPKPNVFALLLSAQCHERFVSLVRELERVVDRSEARDFSIIIEFERGDATLERQCAHCGVPLIAATLVAANDMDEGGAGPTGPVGQQSQTSRQVPLNLQLALNARMKRHILKNRVGREQLRRLCGIADSERILERLRYLLNRCRCIHDAVVEICWVWAEAASDGEMRLRTAAIPVVDPTDDLAFAVERNGTEEAEFFTEQWRCVDEFDERAIAVTDDPQRIGQSVGVCSREWRIGPDLQQRGPRWPSKAQARIDVEHWVRSKEGDHGLTIMQALSREESLKEVGCWVGCV